MIGKLKGKLSEITNNSALIETSGGVFYQVSLTPGVISKNTIGDNVLLYTYLQVRDDAFNLFGFETKAEYDFFKMLLTVSGVGPKTAFTVISFSKIDETITAVKNNDADYFTRIPGLGKKTAMKIILELSQKLKSEFKMESMYLSDDDKTVVDALISLGYSSSDAKKIIPKLTKNKSVEEKINEALKLTVKK